MANDITHQQILDRIDTGNKKLLNAMTQQLGVITDDMVTKDDVKDIVRDQTADIRDEQLRQGGLLDDLDDKVTAIAESVGSELELKERVNKHDERITALESKGKIVIATVTHDSRQIKALQTSKS